MGSEQTRLILKTSLKIKYAEKIKGMMHPENFSLTWHTYSDHLRDMMKELMMKDDFADVTLVSENRKHMKAHKNILSACSPVLKDIVKLEQSAKPIIYMKGIKFSELEAIMQFMYLGEATLHEERMKEFLSVAKSLEIKKLCNVKTETNNDDDPLSSNPVTFIKYSEEQTRESSQMNQSSKDMKDRKGEIGVHGKYNCKYCLKTFVSRGALWTHKQSVHKGRKYGCNHCDFQSSLKGNLKKHIMSQHEGLRYACDQCDYQATQQANLRKHIESTHEGVKYACDQCDFQAATQFSLKVHIESKHVGAKYDCDKCDYEATQQSNLIRHKKGQHNNLYSV